MAFSIQWSCFLSLLCLLIQGDAVWCECSLGGMEIQGGTFNLSNGQNEGSMLQYHCPKGYYPYPELAYRCQVDNQWTPEHSRSRCKRVECPDPTVLQNGHILPIHENRKYYYESKITYHCYSGYTLHGPFRRTCLENGKWSGSNPVCRHDSGDCPDPGVPPGGSRSGNSFEIGDKVMFKCRSKMILMGSEERECQLNGHWSGSEPSCYYKHTYDSPWEVSEAFGGDIKNTLSSNLVNKTQQGLSIKLRRNGTLNIFIAVDVSESIDEDDFQNAKVAISTLIKKIEEFSVYPKYEVVFFSSKIQTVIDILRFYGPNDPTLLKKLLDEFENFYIEREDKYGTNINAVFNQFLEKLGVIKTREKHFSDHHHVIILFTDGGYNTGGAPTDTVERIKSMVYMGQPQQRQEHLDIYVFGIGTSVYDENLKPLTVGTGGKSHYYRLKGLEQLQQTFDEIIDEEDVRGRCGLHRAYGDLYNSKEKRKNFPWVIYISVMTDGITEYCLGSLVSPRFVLTAAHCFKNKTSTATLEVTSGHLLEVETVHIHPGYNISAKVNQGVKEFYDYDVALIELQQDVPITISLRPICLPCTDETNAALKQTFTCHQQEDFLLQNRDKVTFLTKTNLREKDAHVKLGDDRYNCIRQALKAPHIDPTINVTRVVTDNFLCTGGRSKNLDKVSCKGDSGGAVFKNHEGRTIQVALVSWGTKQMPGCRFDQLVDSDDDSRDFHINLFKVLPFLKSILGKMGQSYAHLVFID